MHQDLLELVCFSQSFVSATKNHQKQCQTNLKNPGMDDEYAAEYGQDRSVFWFSKNPDRCWWKSLTDREGPNAGEPKVSKVVFLLV